MAALDVAGQFRERSPADTAIFGPDSGRLVERFVDRAAGQALLARAVSDGSAEAHAVLVTAAGSQRFQVGLWRQRGGDRVRILATFASIGRPHETRDARPALARLSHDMRSPLAAAMGFAELIRTEGSVDGRDQVSAHAASIIAAAWRLASIADDLEGAVRSGEEGPTMRQGEVDLVRLVRRVARLAEPATRAAGAVLDLDGLEGAGAGVAVLADEGTLWSIVDSLIQNALRHASRVWVNCRRDAAGLVLEVLDDGRGISPDALATTLADTKTGGGLGSCSRLARANGGDLEVESTPGVGTAARLRFPASRVLDLT